MGKPNTITSAEFARTLGYSHSTVSRILSGERSPSGRLLVRMISRFDLDHSGTLEAYAGGTLPDYLIAHVPLAHAPRASVGRE